MKKIVIVIMLSLLALLLTANASDGQPLFTGGSATSQPAATSFPATPNAAPLLCRIIPANNQSFCQLDCGPAAFLPFIAK